MPPVAGNGPDMSRYSGHVGTKPNLSPLTGQACPESIEGKGDKGPVLSEVEGMVETVLNHSPCPELVEGG